MQYAPSALAVREQLERFKHSDQLERSKRLLRFLSFTVEKTLEGHPETLTEHAIGTTVYDRPLDFDSALDGIVRAEAYRLRAKLDDYYTHQGRQDPVIIEYPMGSYVPVFRFSGVDFLPETGKVAHLIRSTDWSRTSLDHIATWPRNLKNALGICLRSPFPMTLFWGPEFLTFANDAAYALTSATHPHIIGRPASEGAADWGRLSPILSAVAETGEPALQTDAIWLLDRLALHEERYFTCAFSPVPDAGGRTSGVLAVVSETTRAVLGERRLKTLRELAERNGPLLDATDACRFAASVFERNPYDVPFASIYLYDDERQFAILRAVAGVEPGTGVSSPIMGMRLGALSRLAEAARTGKRQLLKIGGHLGLLPSGAWGIPPSEIAILPLPDRNPGSPIGFVIVGINPYRAFDKDYCAFLEALAARLNELVQQARTIRENESRIREAADLQTLTASVLAKSAGDLRTPLTVVLGLLDEVLESILLPEPQRGKIAMARRNAIRIAKGAADLLDFVDRRTMPAETVLPAYAEEMLHWTEEQTVPSDPAAWQRRRLVRDIRRRIVVVAAEPDFRHYLRDVLSQLYSVEVAADAPGAAPFLQDANLLVLDDSVPEDAAAMVQSIRDHPGSSLIPIVMLSAQHSGERRFRTLASGVDDYLTKPFSSVELMARVHSQIALAEARVKILDRHTQSQLPLSAVLNSIPLGIMIARIPSGTIVFTNEKLVQMFGKLVPQVLTLDDVPEEIAFFPDGTPCRRDLCPLVRAARHGEVVDCEEFEYRLPDGRRFDVRASSSPIWDMNGNMVAAVLLLEEVSAGQRCVAV